MRKLVEKKLNKCKECARNKLLRHAPFRQLKSLDTLEKAQDLVLIDFIIKLLGLLKLFINIVYNIVLVIVDKLTKYIHFILFKELALAEDLAYIVKKELLS